MDYGQKPSHAPAFTFQLEGGHMVYNHQRDTWCVWSDDAGKCGEINANEFGTIRQFKAWAQSKINSAA